MKKITVTLVYEDIDGVSSSDGLAYSIQHACGDGFEHYHGIKLVEVNGKPLPKRRSQKTLVMENKGTTE